MTRPKHSADFSCDLSAPASRLPHLREHTVGGGTCTIGNATVLNYQSNVMPPKDYPAWQAQLKKAHDEMELKDGEGYKATFNQLFPVPGHPIRPVRRCRGNAASIRDPL